jgi:glycosyltransferase involved in cell wall biosynthesis
VESFEPYLNIRYVRHEHAGMALCRTRLVKEARGPLLGFFDDDDIVAPTCVEEHWKAHQKHPDTHVTVLGYSEWSPGLKVSPLMHYVTAVGRQYVDYPSLRHGQLYDFRCFWGGRSSCKRALIESSELFDPQFTWGYEDIELMYRLSKKGSPVRVFYNRNAVHRFMQPMKLEAFLRRSERQGRTAHFFFKKHPDPAIKQYLPIEDAASKWAGLEPVYDEWITLAHKLEQVVASQFSESFESGACKELFLVYGKLHDAAWARGVLAGRNEKMEPAIQKARMEQRGPRILILDEVLAAPDRTAGALRMHRIVKLLRLLGCRITYGAYLPQGFDDHAERLNELGVRTVYLGGGAWGNVKTSGNKANARAHKAIEEIGALDEQYNIVWICFHWLARIYLPLIRIYFTEAKILVDSVDLHYIREARAARVAGGRQETMSAYATRVMELTAYACADAVGVVTDVEKERLALDLPRTRVFTLPTVHDPVEVTAVRSDRQGLVFVGSFWHEPNIDAMVWFVKKVYPLIERQHPGMDVYVIGQEPPNEVKALAGRHVQIGGWVPDTAPYLTRAAVSIAPLRYGSGMKGKIGEALSFGVPVVTTSIGAEGFGIVNGVHALVADTPEEFAVAVCRVMGDEMLWERLSVAGKQLIDERWGSAPMRERLKALLSELLTGAKLVGGVSETVQADGSEYEPAREDHKQALKYKDALKAAASGEMDRAVQLLESHLQERSDHAGGWSDLGVLYYRAGDLDEARRCFETALALPDGWRTLACENLVECLLASNERARAEVLAERWMDKAADMPEAWLLWARFKNEEGNLAGARDAVQHALSIDPANEVARSYLAEIDEAVEGAGTTSASSDG